MKETRLSLDLVLPPGTALQESKEIVALAEKHQISRESLDKWSTWARKELANNRTPWFDPVYIKQLEGTNGPISPYISLTPIEVKLIQTEFIQRLKGVHQMTARFSTRGEDLDHTRFEHIIGATHIAGVAAEKYGLDPHRTQVLRIAALFHDAAHLPFSHALEAIVGRELNFDHDEGLDSRSRDASKKSASRRTSKTETSSTDLIDPDVLYAKARALYAEAIKQIAADSKAALGNTALTREELSKELATLREKKLAVRSEFTQEASRIDLLRSYGLGSPADPKREATLDQNNVRRILRDGGITFGEINRYLDHGAGMGKVVPEICDRGDYVIRDSFYTRLDGSFKKYCAQTVQELVACSDLRGNVLALDSARPDVNQKMATARAVIFTEYSRHPHSRIANEMLEMGFSEHVLKKYQLSDRTGSLSDSTGPIIPADRLAKEEAFRKTIARRQVREGLNELLGSVDDKGLLAQFPPTISKILSGRVDHHFAHGCTIQLGEFERLGLGVRDVLDFESHLRSAFNGTSRRVVVGSNVAEHKELRFPLRDMASGKIVGDSVASVDIPANAQFLFVAISVKPKKGESEEDTKSRVKHSMSRLSNRIKDEFISFVKARHRLIVPEAIESPPRISRSIPNRILESLYQPDAVPQTASADTFQTLSFGEKARRFRPDENARRTEH